MSHVLKLDPFGSLQKPTFVVSLKNHEHIGELKYISDATIKYDLHADEISFIAYRYEENAEQSIADEIFDELRDTKYIYIPEMEEYFAIETSPKDESMLSIAVSGINVCKEELSRIKLYEFEVNTERDIAREEYTKATVFCDVNDPANSLLHRVLYKCPHYSVGEVDPSLVRIQRMFSANDESVYDFLTDTVAKEMDCIFVFNTVNRTINAYDLKSRCIDCGYRGDIESVCPKCGSTNVRSYGDDTNIYADVENLLDSVTVSTNAEEVVNCFRLEAGDDDMTAAIVNRNPNGSQYIYKFSETAKKDMPKALVNKLDAYDELVKSYNKEYGEIIEGIYEDIDKIAYYTSEMMPSRETVPTSAADEVAKLEDIELAPLGMAKIASGTSVSTVNNAIEAYAKVFIDSGKYKAKVKEAFFENKGEDIDGSYWGIWTGVITVTSYADDEDVAETSQLTVKVWDKYHVYLEQKLDKKLKDDSVAKEGSIYDVLSIKDLEDFKEALKLYGLVRLQSFTDSIQGCLDVMIESGQAVDSAEMYEELYIPYFEKLQACQMEMNERSKTVEEWENKMDSHIKRQKEIQKALDFETFLGEELYTTFNIYRREQLYSNSNYVSTDLDNKQIFENAAIFLEVAKEELDKASEHQYQLEAKMVDLLACEEFQDLTPKMKPGNWMRLGVGNDIFKLRIINFEVDYEKQQYLDIEFSNVTRWRGLADDTKSVIDSAKSIASTYGGVMHQVRSSKDTTNYVKDFVNRGLDLTTTKIINNAHNQDIVIGDTGLLARKKEDFVDEYSPNQTKVLGSGIYITRDNWRSVVGLLGNYIHVDPVTGELSSRYGLLAENIVGNLILGNNLGIYSEDATKSMTFNNLGLIIDAKPDEDGTYSRIVDIRRNGESQFYIDQDGNIVLASNQIIQMCDKLDRVVADYADIEKMYVKEATVEKLISEYIKTEVIEGEYGKFKHLIATDGQFENLETNNMTVYGMITANKASIDDLTVNKLDVNALNAYKIEVQNLLADYAKIAQLEADYLKAEDAEIQYAKIAQLNAITADITNINTELLNAKNIIADKADITDLEAETARIDSLVADYANINDLVATKVTADEVDAKIVAANKVITDDLDAVHATIDSLDATYAKITDLEAEQIRVDNLLADKVTTEQLNAAKADIDDLSALFGQLNTLVTGSTSGIVGQFIHLTAQNVVIDDATITSAMIKDLSADKITSGSINTGNVNIESDDGSLTINGSLQQFKDENGNVRIQMGKDASGKFSFTIFDEDGIGVLLDSKGLHENAVPDGLIVDKMVADNANIAGSKLDIDSVISEINGNDTTTIKSNKIWIDETGQSLGASFKQIQTSVGKSVANIIPYYCLSNDDTTAPETGWVTTPPVTGGKYLWRKDKQVLTDGTESWKDPYLVNSGANVNVLITSTNGNIFKGNTTASTTLICTVYVGGKVQTPNSYQWSKKSGNNWIPLGTNATLVVNSSDVVDVNNYQCEVDI